MIVNRAVYRGEFLKGFHPPERERGSLSSPQRQVGILDPVVQSPPLHQLSESPPEGVGLAIDLDENLIEMPAPMREGTHPADPFSTDLGGKYRPEPVPPEPHGLMTNVDAAFGQQVFDVAQRQGVFHLHQHHEADLLE